MAKTKTGSPRAGKRAVRPPPLSSLADEIERERDELVEIVQRAASAQLYLAKRHAKLVRYKDAAEKCMRAFAEIEGNEKGALELGRTLGVRSCGPDLRPKWKLNRKIKDWARDRDWARDHPAIEADVDSPFAFAAFAADEGNKEAVEEWRRAELEPRPWVLSAIEACKGYAGDDEDLKTVESRILLEAGVSPNEIAAFQDGGKLRSLREYADSAQARALKRQAVKLRAKLSTDLSTLKEKRELLVDGTIGALAHAPTRRLFDEQIAALEFALEKLDSRRRRSS